MGPMGSFGRGPLGRLGGGALWAHGALGGISEAISSGLPFRVDGHFDFMAILSRWDIYL